MKCGSNEIIYPFNMLFFTVCNLMNNITHGTTNYMHTDTVVSISQPDVTFARY